MTRARHPGDRVEGVSEPGPTAADPQPTATGASSRTCFDPNARASPERVMGESPERVMKATAQRHSVPRYGGGREAGGSICGDRARLTPLLTGGRPPEVQAFAGNTFKPSE